MAAQRGKDLLLKIDSDGYGSFVTVAGLRSKRLAFNSETVDVTDAESAGRWRELIAGSGVQRASLSGAGVFKDAASDAMIRAVFFAGELMRLPAGAAGLRHAGRAVPDHRARIPGRP